MQVSILWKRKRTKRGHVQLNLSPLVQLESFVEFESPCSYCSYSTLPSDHNSFPFYIGPIKPSWAPFSEKYWLCRHYGPIPIWFHFVTFWNGIHFQFMIELIVFSLAKVKNSDWSAFYAQRWWFGLAAAGKLSTNSSSNMILAERKVARTSNCGRNSFCPKVPRKLCTGSPLGGFPMAIRIPVKRHKRQVADPGRRQELAPDFGPLRVQLLRYCI